MNRKFPRGGFHDETRNQIRVCHHRQLDRPSGHLKQAIFEWHMLSSLPLYIYHQKQVPA
jgi:hypothetical protein